MMAAHAHRVPRANDCTERHFNVMRQFGAFSPPACTPLRRSCQAQPLCEHSLRRAPCVERNVSHFVLAFRLGKSRKVEPTGRGPHSIRLPAVVMG